MRRNSSGNENSQSVDSQNDQFDLKVQVKNNRKSKRKEKKIIHNCCVLLKNQDGSETIIIRQFFETCRLKTIKSITKRALQIQAAKDQLLASQLKADIIKHVSEQKNEARNMGSSSMLAMSTPVEKPPAMSLETIPGQPSMTTLLFILPDFRLV